MERCSTKVCCFVMLKPLGSCHTIPPSTPPTSSSPSSLGCPNRLPRRLPWEARLVTGAGLPAGGSVGAMFLDIFRITWDMRPPLGPAWRDDVGTGWTRGADLALGKKTMSTPQTAMTFTKIHQSRMTSVQAIQPQLCFNHKSCLWQSYAFFWQFHCLVVYSASFTAEG